MEPNELTLSEKRRAASLSRKTFGAGTGRPAKGRVKLTITLPPACADWLRVQPEGISATVERLVALALKKSGIIPNSA